MTVVILIVVIVDLTITLVGLLGFTNRGLRDETARKIADRLSDTGFANDVADVLAEHRAELS